MEQNRKKATKQEDEDNARGMQAVLGAEEDEGAGEGHEDVTAEAAAVAAGQGGKGTVAWRGDLGA